MKIKNYLIDRNNKIYNFLKEKDNNSWALELYDPVIYQLLGYLIKKGNKSQAIRTLYTIYFYIKTITHMNPSLFLSSVIRKFLCLFDLKITKIRTKEFSKTIFYKPRNYMKKAIQWLIEFTNDKEIFNKDIDFSKRFVLALLVTFYKKSPLHIKMNKLGENVRNNRRALVIKKKSMKELTLENKRKPMGKARKSMRYDKWFRR